MLKEQKIKFIEHYQILYEELKKKYENKEKENEQLKTLLNLRNKEIIALKTKIKSLSNNNNSYNNNFEENYSNNNNDEINKIYLENLIKSEMENIKKELILYRNKILTIENYEIQYLAPKLTTGSNNNYQYASNKSINRSVNFDNNINKIYLNMKSDKNIKNKMYHNHIKSTNNLENVEYNNFNDFNTFGLEDNKFIINSSFSKILTKNKGNLIYNKDA